MSKILTAEEFLRENNDEDLDYLNQGFIYQK